MALHQTKGFGETRDLLGFMILFLPDRFPPQSERNMENCFSHLFGGLDSIKTRTKVEATELISRIKEISREAHDFYRQGDVNAGRLRLQDADELLDEVGRILRGRTGAQGGG